MIVGLAGTSQPVDPPNPSKPGPLPVRTLTRGGGYGFRRVRVRVRLENTRVTRDDHYTGPLFHVVSIQLLYYTKFK